MQTAILTLHVIVCVILVVLVLLQSGREGMGVIFGGGGNSVFGNAGAGGILAKLTTFLAVIFICTSLGYNIMTSSAKKDVTYYFIVFVDEIGPAEWFIDARDGKVSKDLNDWFDEQAKIYPVTVNQKAINKVRI